mmetsp:Transcript_70682/g.196613  ORF Transcript_70682/g.196613 Transcript_70682/m.196613 type:complete len:252 (+) Transcript_70682:332-1087(+)
MQNPAKRTTAPLPSAGSALNRRAASSQNLTSIIPVLSPMRNMKPPPVLWKYRNNIVPCTAALAPSRSNSSTESNSGSGFGVGGVRSTVAAAVEEPAVCATAAMACAEATGVLEVFSFIGGVRPPAFAALVFGLRTRRRGAGVATTSLTGAGAAFGDSITSTESSSEPKRDTVGTGSKQGFLLGGREGVPQPSSSWPSSSQGCFWTLPSVMRFSRSTWSKPNTIAFAAALTSSPATVSFSLGCGTSGPSAGK